MGVEGEHYVLVSNYVAEAASIYWAIQLPRKCKNVIIEGVL